MEKAKKTLWEVSTLKILLLVYIVLCIVIAGLNYGMAPGASEQVRSLINHIWHFYENQFKTFLIVLGSWLSWRVLHKKAKMQKRNFAGLIIAALLIHILGPGVSSNPDLYFYAMPFPWSSTGLQTAVEQSDFYMRQLSVWGLRGISFSLAFYVILTILVYMGTVAFGRRWQCSTLCLFNGFISEIFSPAFPLFRNSKKERKNLILLFRYLKGILLVLSFFFVAFWGFMLFRGTYYPHWASVLAKVENYKYLSVELLMAMFLWIAFTGRGYCYYCPLGTVLGFVSRGAGQKIKTDIKECINCGKCDVVCPMNISISQRAFSGLDVIDSNCVGCGHCVDICPMGTLEYSTSLLEKIRR